MSRGGDDIMRVWGIPLSAFIAVNRKQVRAVSRGGRVVVVGCHGLRRIHVFGVRCRHRHRCAHPRKRMRGCNKKR